MGVEHKLACHDCFEFIHTGKWPIIIDFTNHFPRGFNGRKTNSEEIIKGIRHWEEDDSRFNNWTAELKPLISCFVKTHKEHKLRIHDDGGDHPWDPEYPGYCQWKEIPSYCTSELYLPRNLVNDLSINHWVNALSYLKKLEIYLYDELELDEYKEKLGKLVECV